MPLTAGSFGPMVPYVGQDGKSGPIMSFQITAADAIAQGDILTLATGVAKVNNAPGAINLILGIAVAPVASVATPTVNDQVLVAMAHPGRVFIGHMVGTDVTTDYATPAVADMVGADHAYAATDSTGKIIAQAAAGYPVITNAAVAATGAAWPIGFAREQIGGKRMVLGASGTLNPRVYFTFNNNFLAV